MMGPTNSHNVTILHEYGARRHFEALYYLQAQGTIERIQSVEFGLHRRLVMAMLGRHPGWLPRLAHALKTLPRVLAEPNQTLVLFAAPYDPVVPLFRWLKQRNRVIYWSSWPYWDGSNYPRRPLFRRQISQWHQFLDGIAAVTVTRSAQQVLQELGAKSVYIPHCVDTKVFAPASVSRSSSKTKILYVGRLHWEKGVDILIEIARESPWNDVEFWFVGRGNLERAIRSVPTECGVTYFGYIQDQGRLAEIYREADILVLPSRRHENWEELFGITLIEAMASGLPVLATDCIGPREIVEHGAVGFLVPEGDKQELLERLDYLVRRPDVRERLGREGRNRAVASYDLAVVGEAWRQVLLCPTGN